MIHLALERLKRASERIETPQDLLGGSEMTREKDKLTLFLTHCLIDFCIHWLGGGYSCSLTVGT